MNFYTFRTRRHERTGGLSVYFCLDFRGSRAQNHAGESAGMTDAPSHLLWGKRMLLILKPFATPIIWVLVLLALGVILTKRTRKGRLLRVGRYSLLAALVLLFVFSTKPIANLLTYPLESRYSWPSAEVLSTLDVVVVLGGGVHPSGALRQTADLNDDAYPRFYHGVRVFKESGAGLLAFCGGPDREGTESEAEVMKAMAIQSGVAEERILAETQSQNTMENIANLARLLPAGQGRRIGLVTSATHMPRSHKVCSRHFPYDTVIPIPVHCTYDPIRWSMGDFTPSAGGLDRSSIALHEWIGMLWYRLRYR